MEKKFSLSSILKGRGFVESHELLSEPGCDFLKLRVSLALSFFCHLFLCLVPYQGHFPVILVRVVLLQPCQRLFLKLLEVKCLLFFIGDVGAFV